MPDDSCRGCGGLLLEYLICANCREIIQFICRMCGKKTLQRFHEGFCFVPKNLNNLSVMPGIMKVICK